MNAPPFPPNPTNGQRFGNWEWSGGRWVCTAGIGTRVVTTVFTASGPYTPSPGLVTAVVECLGGGGAGGGAGPTPNATTLMSGGGGGSGGYSRIALAAALVVGGVNVTIGAGGQPAAPPGTGTNGHATSFGALCVANGGKVGGTSSGVAGAYAGSSGNGAGVGVGDWAAPGASGQFGSFSVYAAQFVTTAQGSLGGQIFGGNASAGVETGGQLNGVSALANTGAGGSGGCVNQAQGSGAYGGGGASGLCMVTEYCWSDSGDEGCVCPPSTGTARVARHEQQWHEGFDDE